MITTVGETLPPPASGGFLGEIDSIEQQTPLPPPPATPDAAAAYAAAAKARGTAVAAVITKWLSTAPLAMLQQLLDQPRETMPIFRREAGPVVVMRHDHVIECLERTDTFTVDPYAAEMARATDDKAKNPNAFSHFMLGTDRDDLYRLDDVILRRAMSRADERVLTRITRHESEYWTTRAQVEGRREIDVVPTLARCVPLRIVSEYLGVHFYAAGESSVLPGLRGGDRLTIDDDLREVFTFTRIQEGRVPTAEDLYAWVKDAFRNSFNNFNPAHPLFGEFRERGILATELLTVYVHALLKEYKCRIQSGNAVPDTMLTRLLRMQVQVNGGGREAIEQEFAALLGTPPPPGEAARRLSDSMIRSNVFGTAVGAVVNPQEATARVIDSMLRLKDGEYEPLHGSSYAHAEKLAATEEHHDGYAASQEMLRKYALEALRLRPQGEVLLRLCVRDTVLGGVPIRKGTPVFVAYAAAMRDPQAVPRPLAFDRTRDERLTPFHGDKDRAREAPQSLVYLQHGYGRHKCLGRYASEITMRESLRALLRVGPLERRSELELDAQGLYAVSLRAGIG
jgi:cytochrome P450